MTAVHYIPAEDVMEFAMRFQRETETIIDVVARMIELDPKEKAIRGTFHHASIPTVAGGIVDCFAMMCECDR